MDNNTSSASSLIYQTPGGLTVKRLQPSIGAELFGADLRRFLTPEIAQDIRQALIDHGVIFFRDQPLSYANHVALAKIFGPPVIEGFIPDRPELMVLKSDAGKPNPAGGGWHSDGTYLAIAPSVSVLHAITAAPLGGDTLFSNAQAAYAGLSAEVKARIAPLQARSGFAHILKVKKIDGANSGFKSPVINNLPDWVPHPVVRIHPETGEPVLYVNEVHTMDIIGLEPAESAELLRHLCDQIKRPEYQMRWTWTDNAIAIWDNRKVQHYATINEMGPRHVERITITGTPSLSLFENATRLAI